MRKPRAGRSTAHLKLASILLGLATGAGLISQLDQSILRRFADLSF